MRGVVSLPAAASAAGCSQHSAARSTTVRRGVQASGTQRAWVEGVGSQEDTRHGNGGQHSQQRLLYGRAGGGQVWRGWVLLAGVRACQAPPAVAAPATVHAAGLCNCCGGWVAAVAAGGLRAAWPSSARAWLNRGQRPNHAAPACLQLHHRRHLSVAQRGDAACAARHVAVRLHAQKGWGPL